VKDVVTGAFSYTGRHIAEQLLADGREVTTLTRTVPEPLPLPVATAPFSFDDPAALVEAFRGAETLYNTYWIRFPRPPSMFAAAVENSAILFRAAAEAGVRRIVHVSITNPSPDSPYAYFRGKAAAEAELARTGVPFSIVRPTLIYGPTDILINNIAWILRHFPVFFLPGSGEYLVQPVSVEDLAAICIESASASGNVVWDAVGPETFTFAGLVRVLREAVGSRARILRAPPAVALALTRLGGLLLRDVVLTREELAGLMDSLLVSAEPPRGHDRFSDWVAHNAETLGMGYVSELARNWRLQRR
jgi:uncharacterized protein YbjT (DUF2867 family)